MEYTGYHGTHRDAADSICRDENIEFSSSDTEWLGKGAYFLLIKKMLSGGVKRVDMEKNPLLQWIWHLKNI